ncbi:MAG: hypothetical protein RTU30_12860 [Candidatus Thorarchaeota archaeon]
MRAKLSIELKGKAREEHRLDTSVPLDLKLLDKWKSSWISNKEYKAWKKQPWPKETLGELKEGKILRAAFITPAGLKATGSSVIAFRTFIADTAGVKKKLPIIMYGQVKKKLKLDYFASAMDLEQDQLKEVKSLLKSDSWAPISIWQYGEVDGKDKKQMSSVIDLATRFTKAIFHSDFKKSGWDAFLETDYFVK